MLPDDSVRVVSWLPLHHDMGLIGATFGVVYAGGTGFLMPPSAFIQRPMRWLETISRYRADFSVAPNFAYDLCVERSTAEERAALDLSTWTSALSGAEPVRATDAAVRGGFRACRISAEAFRPVYGLAEATLFVSGNADAARADRAASRQRRVAREPRHVGGARASGRSVGGGMWPCRREPRDRHRRPGDAHAVPTDEVGEIWVGGANVARGYWGKPAETEETFRARTSDTDRGPFLRTGDLGFLLDGELFVAGRLKDVVIIRGRTTTPTTSNSLCKRPNRAC